jgi:wyosine [tRNA(Phe)-imidazoG37] synthetase (radical SAM superfamily)
VEESHLTKADAGRVGSPHAVHRSPGRGFDFGRPREWWGNRFVYAVISARAGGLALGVNMNPDRLCNFDCPYCEVDRRTPPSENKLLVGVMAAELRRMLLVIKQGNLRSCPAYHSLPAQLLELRHVALSGDGEPTLAPNFVEAVQAVVRVRAVGGFFKIVLLTNGTGLNRTEVLRGLEFITASDEIWIKLDGGDQARLNLVNRPLVSREEILENILVVGRRRPIVIQSMFPAIDRAEPPSQDIQGYAECLKKLVAGGAQISLVQIYSAARPAVRSDWGHLPLRVLSQIAQIVRQVTGLRTEVF